jgi:hypothetical protein
VAPGQSPCDPKTALYCNDFERETVGQTPQWAAASIKVTSARAWSGSKAIELPGGYGDSSAFIFPLNPARDLVFVRAMVWSEYKASTTEPGSRWSIAQARTGNDFAATDANPVLATFHHYPNGEVAIASQTAVPVTRWVCLEMSFDRVSRIFRAWVNGQEVAEFTKPLNGPGVPGPWTSASVRNEYAHGATGSAWMDDVAFGTARLGCPSGI